MKKKTKNPSCLACARREADLQTGIVAALNGEQAQAEKILRKYGFKLAPVAAEAKPARPATKTYIVKGLGAKFGGQCIKCHQPTGHRPYELAETVLLQEKDEELAAKARELGQRPPPGPHAVAHAICIGIRTKSRVGGGRKLVGEMPHKIEIPR